jgi:hypothetical protein
MTTRTTIRHRWQWAFAVALGAGLLGQPALGAEPLTDEQLDAITAGADDSQLDEIVVHATHLTASGTRIDADGTLAVQRAASSLDTASLLLQDSAQSDLRALVNVNAVQSVVNVLINLNINIDSQVGEVRQLNLSGR